VAKIKEYTSDAIKVLTDKQHVRHRLPMYLGSVDLVSYVVPYFIDTFNPTVVEFIPAALKCVNEIIDNSVDEFTQTTKKNKKLKLVANTTTGKYSIGDNGRGVPIDIHPQTKLYTPETVFGSLRSGRNFGDDKVTGTIGNNGVGSSLVNFVSSEFTIDIHRDGQHYHQVFTDGASNIKKPTIRDSATHETGTTISFQLDPLVFKSIILPEDLMHNRAIEVAFNNPGIMVEYNKHKYSFKKGFDDVINTISQNYFKISNGALDFYIAFDLNDSIDEQIFTWVNGTYLFEGGICNSQFLNAFFAKTMDHLSKEAKKQKCEVTKNDVRQGLTVFGILKLQAPNFDSQTKTRLTGPNLRKDFDELIEENWGMFVKKNKEWFEAVLLRAFERHHKDSNSKALKNHEKNLNKKVPDLTDATNRDRSKCMLFLTEGLSASSKIIEVRDPTVMAFLPLSGKINNVYGCTPAQLLKMGKITNLLSAIGLTPGRAADRKDLRYSKIICAMDGDVDGSDIFSLLINLFFMWPELFDKNQTPIVHRLIVPNVCLTKGKQRKHFATRSEYDDVKHQYQGWNVAYYKGLGSMVKADWELVIDNLDTSLIPIIDDGHIASTLELLFGLDAEARKQWLQESY
jgi:DNA gyrase subunit B